MNNDTITIAGQEYRMVPATTADLKIVRATRGYRDYIYVGRITREDDFYVVAAGGANVRQYREKGLTGAASDPDLTTLDRCETEVRIAADSVVDILDCGPAWGDVL